MARHVDVYFSLMSPWAFLGHAPFMAIAAKHQLEISWKPVALIGLFAETGGAPLAKRAIQRRRLRDVELQRWSEKRGRTLKLRPKHWPFDPSLGDRVVLAAAALGKNPAAFLGDAFPGVWERELDLGDRETISKLLSDNGLDAEAILARADEPDIVAAYAANHDNAIAADVFGSPSYVLDGEVFWGQDRLDLLDDALTTGRAPYRPLE